MKLVVKDKEFVNKYVKTIKKMSIVVFLVTILFFLLNLICQSSTGKNLISNAIDLLSTATAEKKQISFTSTGYNTTGGSVKVTKSAEWTDRGEATLTIDVDSVGIPRDIPEDIIIVLDSSFSLNESTEVDKPVKDAIFNFVEKILSIDGSRIAFISFNSEATIHFGFTNDINKLTEAYDNIVYGGETNYYKGLKAAESVLKGYKRDSSKELHLMFITDGYAIDGVGSDELEYKLLKSLYPYMIIDGVQTEITNLKEYDVDRVSDRQYYVTDDNIAEKIMDAGKSTEYYSNFNLVDVIDTTYFDIDEDSLSVDYGTVTLSSSTITWNLVDGKFKTGYQAQLEIKLKVKDKYLSTKGYFPTNTKTTVSANTDSVKNINATTTETPVLKSYYTVKYSANAPSGCTNSFSESYDYFPFEILAKITKEPGTCTNYQFRGWQVEDDAVQIVGSDSLVMPAYDITINAVWSELSIVKSMDGTISTRSTLYELLAAKAVSSIGLSFSSISSSTNGQGVYRLYNTKDNTYPILFFRGNVSDNNVIFGGFCWKIVRTTDTGGVKILYNGKPSNGSCTATGVDTTIGKTKFYDATGESGDLGSLAENVGYMTGTIYKTKSDDVSEDYWPNLIGKTIYSSKRTVSVYIGSSVRYSGGKYTVRNATLVSSSVDLLQYAGYYYCYLTTPGKSCEYAYYVLDSGKVIKIENGELGPSLYNQAKELTWTYGNDVTYSNGVYTLTNTTTNHPFEVADNIAKYESAGTQYHYTCKSSSSTCSTVYYYFSYTEEYGAMSYIELSGGKKIENAVDEMLNTANTDSSLLKSVIDTWYGNNMTAYTYMLEDAVWCNDRTGDTGNGWYKDDSLLQNMHFSDTFNSCSTEDSYTVGTANGNGDLTYPVGTITASEANYAGGYYRTYSSPSASYTNNNTNYYLYNGLNVYTMSGAYFNNIIGYVHIVDKYGTISVNSVDGLYANKELINEAYVRPMVSLKPGVFVSDGNGTQNDPYIIEMS